MIQFGTGGFRAIIGENFTKENVQLIGEAIYRIMLEDQYQMDQPVVIGYDRRFLSKESAQWLAEILVHHGVRIKFIGYSCPTPLVMFVVKECNLAYGFMITASHNPAIYNGVKVFSEGGRDADQAFTRRIEETCNKVHLPAGIKPYHALDCIDVIDPLNEYIDLILSFLDVRKIRDAHLKIAFDPMYGVSTTALQTILMTTRCYVDVINQRHDTLFGGKLPSPNAETIQQLQVMVQEKDYDLGIATDGDADRLGVVDSDGTFVDPNKILSLIYYYFLNYKGLKGDVVRNLSTTMLVDRIAEDYGFASHEVPVGFKHITHAMKEHDAIIGGESSGGLTVKGYLNGKDSVFAASLLVEIVATTQKTIAQLTQEIEEKYGKLYTREEAIDIRHIELQTLLERMSKVTSEAVPAALQVSHMDGLKVWFAAGWVLVRPSGTEPLLRISCEGSIQADLPQYIELMKECLEIT